jgi:hypothetical protein
MALAGEIVGWIEAKPTAADLEPWRDRQPAVVSTVMRGS